MTLAVLADAVLLVRQALLASSDVTALVTPASRIATASPTDTTKPWIRLTRVGGPASPTAPMRVDRALIQVDCFVPAGKQAVDGVLKDDIGAMTLARTVRAVLCDAANFQGDTGVITNITETLGPTNQPDTSRTPPTPRVHFSVAVTTRPAD